MFAPVKKCPAISLGRTVKFNLFGLVIKEPCGVGQWRITSGEDEDLFFPLKLPTQRRSLRPGLYKSSRYFRVGESRRPRRTSRRPPRETVRRNSPPRSVSQIVYRAKTCLIVSSTPKTFRTPTSNNGSAIALPIPQTFLI